MSAPAAAKNLQRRRLQRVVVGLAEEVDARPYQEERQDEADERHEAALRLHVRPAQLGGQRADEPPVIQKARPRTGNNAADDTTLSRA